MPKSAINIYLAITAFVCGGVVMVIELIGSRVIGPPFGVSLFVWTSLITVTLVSLALGYWAGGRLSERNANPATLFVVIAGAGLYLMAVPLIKGAVLDRALSLGLRSGSLASSTALFGAPLFLLGIVSPYVVKLYLAGDSVGVGKTVGWLYAVSTAGSFLGTLLTGFILIPALGVNNIIYLSSLILLALTTVFFLIFRKRPVYLLLLIAPIAPLYYQPGRARLTREDGTRVEVVERRDTAYGQIKVVDYSYGETRLREFLVDNIIQGALDVKSGLSISGYTYFIERLAHIYNKGAENALVIGLGGGFIPAGLGFHNIKTDVVEISPEIAETAKRFFIFDDKKTGLYIEDGRYFLRKTGKSYDIIVIDAFSGDVTPSHLMSLEAFRLVKKRLADHGVVLINFIGGNLEEDRPVPASLYRTLKACFSTVTVYADKDYFKGAPAVVNFIFVAHDDARLRGKTSEDAFAPVYPPIKDAVGAIFTQQVSAGGATPCRGCNPFGQGPFVFTDDFSPVDFYDTRLREKWRGLAISGSDRAVVVN